LGVNAGASFFIVLALFLFPNIGFFPLTLISFIGATITSLLVLILGSLRQDGMQVVTVTLAGASLTALFSSLTNGLLVANEQGFEDIIFWLTGSIDGRNLEMIRFSLPFFVAGWILSLLISKQLNILQMGDQVAIGLGQRVNQIKWICGIIVVILAGVSVAVAGPIVFVGLIVPHFVRKLVGHDYRFVIPFCFVCGAILLLSADILARFVMREQEIPVGVMTALIGAPIYLMLVRRKREVL
jgi:iron complex transport system permease protein